MKIGIYDEGWGELICGGHMYVGVIAEALASRGHDVVIVHHAQRIPHDRIAEAFGADLSRVGFRQVPSPKESLAHISGRRWPISNLIRKWKAWEELSRPYDLFIHSTGGALPEISHARRSVLLVHFPWMSYESHHGYEFEAWSRQPAPLRGLQRFYHSQVWNLVFGGYHLVVTNSEYTRSWIRRRWRVESTVVYPPARPSRPATTAKQALILSLGRLFPDKKYEAMIDSFKALCDRGLSGWRYVIIGGTGKEPELQRYAATLKERTRGYPIDLLTDLPGSELERYLAEASLFWHAKGYGVDPEARPEDLEHFGIATVEAMSAGCVPLVFRGGGQVEIIREGIDGHLWEMTDQLIEKSWSLAHEDKIREQMASSARDRSRLYSKERCVESFFETLRPLGRFLNSLNGREGQRFRE